MEIPELSIDEIRKIFREMWIGSTMGSHGFILQKLGPVALEELNNQGAEHCAMDNRARGVDNPMKFAMGYAVVGKNVFGSDVMVEGDELKAVYTNKRCAALETAMGFVKKGMPLNKEQYCDGCINGYFKKVAENLGFKLEAEFTDGGCEMTISSES